VIVILNSIIQKSWHLKKIDMQPSLDFKKAIWKFSSVNHLHFFLVSDAVNMN